MDFRKTAAYLFSVAINIIGLQTPKGRLVFFACIFALLLTVPFSVLTSGPSLSLYQHLGIPSPSVGLTRASWLLLHGEFRAAAGMNPLVYPVIAITIGIVAKDIAVVLQNYRPIKRIKAI